MMDFRPGFSGSSRPGSALTFHWRHPAVEVAPPSSKDNCAAVGYATIADTLLIPAPTSPSGAAVSVGLATSETHPLI